MLEFHYPRVVRLTRRQGRSALPLLKDLFRYLGEEGTDDDGELMTSVGDGLYVTGNGYQGERKGHLRYYFTDPTGTLKPSRKGVTLDVRNLTTVFFFNPERPRRLVLFNFSTSIQHLRARDVLFLIGSVF